MSQPQMQPEETDTAPVPPPEGLAALYAGAEAEATRAAEGYLAAMTWKRRTARLLRLGTVLGAAGGAGLPLLGLEG
uniref:SLATT domain-containing protein n=1 Tax=Streptomyces sp. SBT349 TaxID=1580539 RepID=UPI000AC56605